MRWHKKLGLIFGAILALACFSPDETRAIGPNNLECVETSDGVICPDLYCTTGSITCDTTGRQCYCQPQSFGTFGTQENTYCEIATGSEAWFEVNGDGSRQIIIRNGLWGAIVDEMATQGGIDPNLGVDVNARGIIFKEEKKVSDSISYYSSSFLTFFKKAQLDRLYHRATGTSGLKGVYNRDDVATMGMGFFAKIIPGADSGVIYNQTFELTKSWGGNKQICGTNIVEKGKVFFHKLTGVAGINDAKDTACVGTPKFMADLIFPTAEKNNSDANPYHIDRGLMFNAILTRNCVGLQADKNILGFDHAKEVIDASVIGSGLIVPPNRHRQIHQSYVKDRFGGLIFPANDPDRDNKIEQLRNLYNKICFVDLGESVYDMPNFCDSFTYITNLLKTGPNRAKSLSQIVADELNDISPSCAIIDPSYGNLRDGESKQNYLAMDNVILEDVPKKESELNRLAPKPLLDICEENFRGDHFARIRCKYNALNCYVDAISPQLEGKNVCDFMNKDEALRRARWIFCPVLTTETNAADNIQRMINEVLAIDVNPVEHEGFQKVWRSIRDIANIFLLITLLFIVVSQVSGIGLSNYQIKVALPKLITATLLVNISLYISNLAIDFTNILASGIAQTINNFTIGIQIPDTTFENLIFRSSGNILIIGAILALVLPGMFVAFLGVVSCIFIIAMRKTFLMLLILVAPLAFAIMVLPGGESVFNKWRKSFSTMILIYPAIQLVYSFAVLTRAVMSGVNVQSRSSAALMPIIANIMPFVSILFVPTLVKSMMTASSKLAKTIANGASWAGRMARERNDTRSKSAWRQGLRDYTQKGITNKLIGNTQARRMRLAEKGKAFKPRFSNKFTNFITNDAIGALTGTALSRNSADKRNITNIIGSDAVLLKALMDDQGTHGMAYDMLDKNQQAKFDQIMAFSQGQIYLFNSVAPIIIAQMGITDQSVWMQSFANAEKTGVRSEEYIGVAYGTAKKQGDLENMSFLKSHMTKAPRDISASSTINDASVAIQRGSSNLQQAIANSGGDLSRVTGLSGSDVGILASLRSMGASQQEILTATADAVSRKASFGSQSDKNVLTQVMTELAGKTYTMDSSGNAVANIGTNYTVNSKTKKAENLSDSQVADLSYSSRVLELVNQNLSNNGTNGIGPISFKDAFGFTLENNLERGIVSNRSTESLPDGWSEDRSFTRNPSNRHIYKTYEKEVESLPPDLWYPKLFDAQRTPEKKIGSTTTHILESMIMDRINRPINLTGNLPPSNHMVTSIGASWYKMNPHQKTAVSNQIVESIYNSMVASGTTGRFGVNSLDEARREGPEKMMRLIGIVPEEIER